jgi:hypothetical protein
MISKRTLVTLFSLHAEFDAKRQEMAPLRDLLADPKADFESRMDASAKTSQLNDLREYLFPQVREAVFSLPEGQGEDLKARYLELDARRASVQEVMRGMTAASPSYVALDAMRRVFDNVKTNTEIGDDAIAYLKQLTNNKNGT